MVHPENNYGKVFLFKDGKVIASGVGEIPAITPKELFPMEDFECYSKSLLRFSISIKMSRRARSRLFGKKSKYTYRTIRQHCKK